MNIIQRQFIKYVSLNILSTLGVSLYILVDTFFIAQGAGTNGLAALNIALPIYGFIFAISNMISIGFGTRFKIQYKDIYKKSEIFSKGFYFCLIISSIFVILGIFFSRNIAHILGATGEILNLTDSYLKVVMIFTPAFMLNSLFNGFIRNDHNPTIVTKAVLLSSLFNCVFDYIFIFPFKMGMFGAALATAISPVVGLFIMSSHFIFKKNTFKLVKTKVIFKEFFELSSLGITSLINEISSSVVIIVFNFIMLRYAGNIGVAAYGVVANMALVVIAIFNGIANGIQPLVSENYSKAILKNMTYLIKSAIILGIVISVIIYFSLYFNSEFFTGLFNPKSDRKLLFMAVQGIKIYFLAIPFACVNIVIATSMQAMEMPRISFIISILRGIIIIVPCSFLMSNLYATVGLWASYTLTEIIVCLISILFFVKFVKTKKKQSF